MKSTFSFFEVLLLMCGVFGPDEDEVKSVSVMEGDSVTLNPDPTQIQGFILILWRFGDPVIAQINGIEASYPSYTDIFSGRLQLDQTGFLTINNMRNKHSGLYTIEVIQRAGTLNMKFTVTVYESPSAVDAGVTDMKLVSVMEGDPVILQTAVPQLTGDELIVWRFGEEGKLIAKHDIEAKSSPLYDETDESLRDRLKLDQTGSLTITNTRKTDSGHYKVKISSNKQTLYQKYIVTVSGVFDADADEVKTVMEGDSVTLNTDLTQIQGIIQILWRFGEKGSTIAQIDGSVISYKDVKGFKGRLQLDPQTGSLTITNVRTNHSGPYKAEIIHKTGTSNQKFSLTVYESPSVIAEGETELKSVLVKEGDSVTLDVPQLTGDELIVWRFGEEGKLIAKHDIETKSSSLYDKTDERFRDRLKLDQTGSLIITNTRTTDTGEYKVKISSNKLTLYKRFIVTVSGVFGAETDEVKSVSVMEGDSVTLNPDLTQIKKFNLIQWWYGDSVIAQIDKNDISYPSHTEIFRDRMQLDQTGSLTIRNMRTKHSGLYKAEISHSDGTSPMQFNVSMYESPSVITGGKTELKSVSMTEGDSVTLHVPQIQGDELIVWRFGEEGKLIAKADIEAKRSPLYYDEERFRDRLKLDQTGSLIITNTRTTDTGYYTVKISSNKQTLSQQYVVSISGVFDADADEVKTVMEGDSVTLNPDLTQIQGVIQIQWRFGEKGSTIAQIEGSKISYEDVKLFKGRLQLNQTGSLTITNVRINHSGPYEAEISHKTGTSNQKFSLTVYESPSVIAGAEAELKSVSMTEGDPVTLHVPQIQGDELIVWRFGEEGKLIAKADIEAKSSPLYDETDERFRDRLKLDQTGSLIITNTRTTDSGDYKVKISSNNQTLYKRFTVTVSGVFYAETEEVKSVMEGDSVTLNPDLTQIQGIIQIMWRFGEPGLTIARFKNGISYDGKFKDRLQLNQTGSLTIKNMRTNHSGLYKLKIDHDTGASDQKFSVTVYESPSVIVAGVTEMKLMSVTEGDSVTLDVPQLTGDELIVWRFGDEGKLIAKADIETKSSSLYDKTDERFRDRLKLDQTGSLIITNTRNTDSGEYKVKISSNNQTSYKRFTVTVSDPGFSAGAVAGIVVGVLLLAAAAVGVMYYLRPSNVPSQTRKYYS
ncbi:uncharacterized protein LOC132160252 isoform X2 [Carassius carassius]|uniref:uncharacterized protein LOC132160252 isoform X2 n=1 Tax=Carassius carassius TaxID=217509 RepID=UPI0028697763|nr:uncharacterized protein LOC132160252 isoform X2 [Carassius carassius]